MFKGDASVPAKYNHSACLFEHSIVFFGGSRQPNENKNSVLIYDLDKGTYSQKFCSGTNFVSWRMGHVAEAFGNEMFVFGGREGEERERNIPSLNLSSLEWCCHEVESKAGIPNFEQAASCTVISRERAKIFNANSNLGPFDDIQLKKELKGEGIYVFGGLVNGKPSNSLYCLRPTYPLKFKKLRCKGVGPCPRLSCTLDYYREMHFLVVHAGMAEGMSASLKDLFLFDLENLNWILVNIRDEYPIGRHEHFSAVAGEKLFVLGGLTNNSYVGSEIYTVNLNSMARGESKEIAEEKNKIIENRYNLKPKGYQKLIDKFRKANKKKSERFINKLCRLAHNSEDEEET